MELFALVVLGFGIICFIDALQNSKELRNKIRKVLGWVCFIAWGVLGGSIALLQYVGVYVVYVCVPVGLISAGLWLYLWKHMY